MIPKPDKFIFNDGANRDMINILGTIPVPYKGHNYNIPVSLWLLETHPYHAPICYVKPTTDMQIKVSKHVDQSGKMTGVKMNIYCDSGYSYNESTADTAASFARNVYKEKVQIRANRYIQLII